MKKRRLLTLVGSICLVLVLAASAFIAACAPAPPAPLTPAEFYAQNEATLVVNWGVGGSTDFATRIIASHWSRFVEGGKMVVKNISGGGGIPGANYVWDAKPDGLTLLLDCPHSAQVPVYIFAAEGAKYDIAEWEYIANFGLSELAFEVGVHTPYNTLEDVIGATGFRFGASGPEAQGAIGALLLIEALDLKDAKIVLGHAGSKELKLSLQREEVDGTTYSVITATEWFEDGVAKEPLVVLSRERSLWWPDVRTLTEVVTLSPDGEMLLTIFQNMMSSRVILTTPGVPQDRVDFLREIIFDQMLHDKAVVKQLKMNWKIWPEVVSGEEWAERMRQVKAISREDIERLRAMLQEFIG